MPEVKVKRSEFASFLNTTPSTTATYSRMGKGITSQTISYNPTTNSQTFIHEDSATTTLDSYAPSINTPQICYAGEAVFDFVDGLRRSRAVGSDAETDIVLVYIYKAGTTSGSYVAERCNCVISIEDFGGDGGAPTNITYTVSLNGDPVIGQAAISSQGVMTFTANS